MSEIKYFVPVYLTCELEYFPDSRVFKLTLSIYDAAAFTFINVVIYEFQIYYCMQSVRFNVCFYTVCCFHRCSIRYIEGTVSRLLEDKSGTVVGVQYRARETEKVEVFIRACWVAHKKAEHMCFT